MGCPAGKYPGGGTGGGGRVVVYWYIGVPAIFGWAITIVLLAPVAEEAAAAASCAKLRSWACLSRFFIGPLPLRAEINEEAAEVLAW